jgi:hypothetical protein
MPPGGQPCYLKLLSLPILYLYHTQYISNVIHNTGKDVLNFREIALYLRKESKTHITYVSGQGNATLNKVKTVSVNHLIFKKIT